MECTQRLEYTQNLYETHSQGCAEEIGFLGICGTKYPVKKGPNKIGRDPQICDIILNVNSVSRQHAVINILKNNCVMLMDLGSANKTILGDKKLEPYIACPLKDGDTVQFGDVFGIFRLLDQDDDLPMTQAIHIPDTPVSNHYVSRINKVPITMVPESPDVSDRDDSFVAPSQKVAQITSDHNFIRPSSKTISIQPVGSNKIDNVFWNSSKKSKSLSLSLNNSNTSLDGSDPTVENCLHFEENDIHEMETQDLLPKRNELSGSIHAAETQMPEDLPKQSIYSEDTQAIPTLIEHNMPGVQKISTQHEMQINFYTTNKENKDDFYEAETQLYQTDKPNMSGTLSKKITGDVENTDDKCNAINNSSHDVIIFDEIDSQSFDGPFESQSLLPEGIKSPNSLINSDTEMHKNKVEKVLIEKANKRTIRINSNESTDCEDIDMVLTQVIPRSTNISDEDITDCEDNETNITNQLAGKTDSKSDGIEDLQTQIIVTKELNENEKKFEDIPTQIIVENTNPGKSTTVKNCEEERNLEDLPTQIILEDIEEDKPMVAENAVENTKNEDLQTQIIVDSTNPGTSPTVKNCDEETNLEDLPTQIILEDIEEDKPTVAENSAGNSNYEDLPTQILDEDLQSVNSVTRVGDENKNYEKLTTKIIDLDEANSRKSVQLRQEEYSEEIIKSFKIPLQVPKKIKQKDIVSDEAITIDDDKYYQSTQDIYNDLNTQEEYSPEIIGTNNSIVMKKSDNIYKKSPNSVMYCNIDYRAQGKQTSQKHINEITISGNDQSKGNKCISNINKEKKLNGGDNSKTKVKRIPSDSSDTDSTPKKKVALKFTESDLPNTQEIKEFVKSNPKHEIDVFSSDSEIENNLREDALPLFSKKSKGKIDAKLDLTKKFEALPTRLITRIRKPTEKGSKSILKPTFLTEQEDGIDKEIITENISRLKTIFGRHKNHNKESNKKLDKVSLDKEKETENQNVRGEASKFSNSHLNDKSTSENSKNITRNELKNTGSNVVTESTNNRTRSKKIENNKIKKDNEENSPKHLKVDKPVISKTLRTLQIEIQELNHCKTSLTSAVGSNQNGSRNKRRGKEKVKNKNESPEFAENGVKPKRTYKKRVKKSPERNSNQQISPEPVTELRRSTRIKATKLIKENHQSPPKLKSILKTSVCDQSAVYNKSSESMIQSPKTLKRSGEFKEFYVPSPKRSRSTVDHDSSLRPQKTQYVLFTTFPSKGVQDKLEKLGAVTVSDVRACTVLLTTALRRTIKLLCAVGLGKPVVGPAWVQACVDTNTIVDPWLYLLKDEEAEKRFHFDLRRTLLGKRNYLQGYTVSSTPNVLPPVKEMKQIVECSGGVWGERGSGWVVVSTPRDAKLWPALRRRGAVIVSVEFVLAGVLRQIPDVKSYLYV